MTGPGGPGSTRPSVSPPGDGVGSGPSGELGEGDLVGQSAGQPRIEPERVSNSPVSNHILFSGILQQVSPLPVVEKVPGPGIQQEVAAPGFDRSGSGRLHSNASDGGVLRSHSRGFRPLPAWLKCGERLVPKGWTE